jgi:hypothetical protein
MGTVGWTWRREAARGGVAAWRGRYAMIAARGAAAQD